MQQSEKLRQYNRWRRGEEDWSKDERGPDPKELGLLIDAVADRLEVLEREHVVFFDNWHRERRLREKLQPVVDAAIRLVSAKAWAGVSDEDVMLEQALMDAGLLAHNVVGNGRPACGTSSDRRERH